MHVRCCDRIINQVDSSFQPCLLQLRPLCAASGALAPPCHSCMGRPSTEPPDCMCGQESTFLEIHADDEVDRISTAAAACCTGVALRSAGPAPRPQGLLCAEALAPSAGIHPLSAAVCNPVVAARTPRHRPVARSRSRCADASPLVLRKALDLRTRTSCASGTASSKVWRSTPSHPRREYLAASQRMRFRRTVQHRDCRMNPRNLLAPCQACATAGCAVRHLQIRVAAWASATPAGISPQSALTLKPIPLVGVRPPARAIAPCFWQRPPAPASRRVPACATLRRVRTDAAGAWH